CNTTIQPNGYILSESVCTADYYKFRFTPLGGGPESFRSSANYNCFLNQVTPALSPGDYEVSVKVSQNGVEGVWGPPCTITIDGPIAPKDEISLLRSNSSNLNATLFPNPNKGKEVRLILEGLEECMHTITIQRSEERRVGKEWRERGIPE